MRPSSVSALLLLLLTLGLVPMAASAGAFTVAPTRILLTPEDRVATVEVRNRGREPVLLQLELYRWHAPDGTERLDPTRELLAVPPLFRLAPGEARVIRVGLRTAYPTEREGSWRLMVSEVPDATRSPERGGVRFALRLSLPVFARVPGARADVLWSVRRDGRRLVIEAHNRGRAHLRHFRIALEDAAGRTHPVSEEAGYLLPGERVRWVLAPAPAAAPRALVVETAKGARRVPLALPNG